jgi:N-acetyl-gamma-glutamyl-phosphate reductase
MRVGVIGASGYAGGELLRLLALHPEFEPSVITAHSNAGELINSVHPHLTSYAQRSFSSFDAKAFADCELVFLALPHGESAAVIAQLPKEAKIIDLGADYRLKSANSWTKYYGGLHAGTWTYGLPELPGALTEIAKSHRVANPGCYATSIALGISPAKDFIDLGDVVVVAASGTTGAGRSAKINLIASEVMGSLTSYKFGGVHQHTPEIEEATGATLSFTPILAPMPRGILSTVTAKLMKKIDTQTLHDAFTQAYKDSYFVSVLPLGQMPKTSAVTGTNNAQLQVAIDEHTNRAVISVAIDNLGKGAAGQAIQNANIICGFDQKMGLILDGLGS